MTILAAIAAIVSIISVFSASGVQVAQFYQQFKNQELRSAIQTMVANVTSQLKSGRLNVTKLLSLLQNKNNAALQSYLYSNPLVSKTFQEIQDDADLIAKFQARANHLESLISQYEAELNSLGYSQSISGLTGEQSKAVETGRKLEQAVAEHEQLEREMEQTKISVNRPFSVDTSHLDAVSQNINGGTTNA